MRNLLYRNLVYSADHIECIVIYEEEGILYREKHTGSNFELESLKGDIISKDEISLLFEFIRTSFSRYSLSLHSLEKGQSKVLKIMINYFVKSNPWALLCIKLYVHSVVRKASKKENISRNLLFLKINKKYDIDFKVINHLYLQCINLSFHQIVKLVKKAYKMNEKDATIELLFFIKGQRTRNFSIKNMYCLKVYKTYIDRITNQIPRCYGLEKYYEVKNQILNELFFIIIDSVCMFVTSKGRLCLNKAKNNNKLCGTHLNKEKNDQGMQRDDSGRLEVLCNFRFQN